MVLELGADRRVEDDLGEEWRGGLNGRRETSVWHFDDANKTWKREARRDEAMEER